MKKRLVSYLIFLLLFFSSFNLFFLNINNTKAQTNTWEIVERGLTWDKYYNPVTKQYRITSSIGAVNYQDDTGWHPINTSIKVLPQGHPARQYGYVAGCEDNLMNVYFKQNSGSEYPICFAYNKSQNSTLHTLRSKLLRVGYVDPSSGWKTATLQTVNAVNGQIIDNYGEYRNIFYGTDARWIVQNGRLKEEIIVSEDAYNATKLHPPSSFGLSNQNSWLVWVTKLDYKGLVPEHNSTSYNGNFSVIDNIPIHFKDAFGRVMFSLPVGRVYEQNNPDNYTNIRYRVIQYKGEYYLLAGAPVSWFNNAEYPVVVDPSVEYQVGASGDDCYVRTIYNYFYDDTAYALFGAESIGVLHSAFRFTGVTIPNGVTIDSAKLIWNAYQTRSDNINTKISAEDSFNPSQIASYDDFVGRTLTTATVDWDFTTDVTAYSWYETSDFSSVIQELVDSYDYSSGSAMIIFIKDDGTSTSTYLSARTYDDNSIYASKLNITYTTPPSNNPPSQSGESPTNGSTGISLTPSLHVICTDSDGGTMNATWWSNSSGSWVQFASNTSIANNTNITQTNNNFSSYSTTYWWSVNLSDGTDWCNETYHFTTRTGNEPNPPSSFTATAVNRTKISLTWNKGTKADYTYIRYKQGATPPSDRSDGTFLYNNTGTSTSIDGLSFGTQYSFKAWSWNTTDSLWSASNATDSATTDSNNAPSFTGENPANNSVDQELSLTWNITIEDPEGDKFNWSIECSNGQNNSANNENNGSKTLSLSGLSDSTEYKVWVNATDAYGAETKHWYNFTTKDTTGPSITLNVAGHNKYLYSTSGLDHLNYNYTYWEHPQENYIYINATVTDASGVDKVFLNVSKNNIWTNGTYEMTNTGGNYYEYNLTNVEKNTTISFDIYACDTENNKNTFQWMHPENPSRWGRKKVTLNCTNTRDLNYTIFYFSENPELTTDERGYTHRREQPTDNAPSASAYLQEVLPPDYDPSTGAGLQVTCGGAVALYLDINVTIEAGWRVNNAYFHHWEKGPNEPISHGYQKQRWSSMQGMVGDDNQTVLYMDDNVTAITPGPTYYLYTSINHNYSKYDVNIYNGYDIQLLSMNANGFGIYSCRNLTSFMIVNVPDNDTLNNTYGDSDNDGLSDWEELYVYYTNPFVSDTDNDGVNDYGETQSGSDPNDYTDTTFPNNPPTQSGESPVNGSTGISLTPSLHVICTDSDGDTMNATWWSNSSGSWIQFASNTSIVNNTNITQTNSNFSSYSTTYWWSVNLSDGEGGWYNETYHFTRCNVYS